MTQPQPAAPVFTPLELPAAVGSIEFISDLHLQATRPATFAAWKQYLERSDADAIFILGDLFEAWIGDDILRAPAPMGEFERACAGVLKAASARTRLYFMVGNRDFTVGRAMLEACGMTGLEDPALLTWQRGRAILTHGDLLCLKDVNYLAFRKIVRDPAWLARTLALPLPQRIEMARQMRMQSGMGQPADHPEIMDVEPSEVLRWLDLAGVPLMIHGHTHRPADHHLDGRRERIVLTDWELDTSAHAHGAPRAEALRWDDTGLHRVNLVPGAAA